MLIVVDIISRCASAHAITAHGEFPKVLKQTVMEGTSEGEAAAAKTVVKFIMKLLADYRAFYAPENALP